MLGDTFNQNQPESDLSDIQSKYLIALRHLINGEEDLANGALNVVRHDTLNGTYFTEFNDSHAQTIMPDLTANNFMGLYGDLKCSEEAYRRLRSQYNYTGKSQDDFVFISSPWIRQTELLGMIAVHVQALGNEQDVQNCRAFLMKASTQYNVPLPSLKLVA